MGDLCVTFASLSVLLTFLFRAEMDYRTGSGRYKKVMWYNKDLGYGNDVCNQPVEAWKKEHKDHFISFVKPFLPMV